MTRELSLPVVQGMLAQHSRIVLLVLLDVAHADLAETIRLVNNTKDIVSNGNTYTATAFEATLPPDTEDRLPTAQLRVTNVDQTLMTALRSVSSSPTFTLRVVNSDTPDVSEWGPMNMELRGHESDAQFIRLNLSQTDLTQEGFPYPRFDPPNVPGLF
jgi:hypothetical protein